MRVVIDSSGLYDAQNLYLNELVGNSIGLCETWYDQLKWDNALIRDYLAYYPDVESLYRSLYEAEQPEGEEFRSIAVNKKFKELERIFKAEYPLSHIKQEAQGHAQSSEYSETIDRLQVYEAFVALDKTDSMVAERPTDTFTLTRGKRQYELKNHLGNVLATITDRKLPHDNDPDGLVDYYKADIVTAKDYYPFGMQMPGRSWTADSTDEYRFGFNGKEKDNDLKGPGNSYNFGARIYDPRIGRWLSIDPKFKKYPQSSPYVFALNNGLIYEDPDGEDIVIAFSGGTADEELDNGNTNTTKKFVNELKKAGMKNFKNMKTATYNPGLSVDEQVNRAFSFIKNNYKKDEQIAIYGYSQGGDAAVELAQKLDAHGYKVDLLVTVDAADGPGLGSTVNRKIPDNVEKNINRYQDDRSKALSKGAKNSKEEKDDSIFGEVKADSKELKIENKNVDKTQGEVTHGNIDEKSLKENLKDSKESLNYNIPTNSNVEEGQDESGSTSSSTSP